MLLRNLIADANTAVPLSSMKFARNFNFDIEITGVTDDSRTVEYGNIFVCVKGENFDGHDAAKDAIDMGAYAVICERDVGLKDKQIIVPDSRKFYGLLCAAWFNHPEKKMMLIGVTGTNGKTTMTSMIAAIISSVGKKVGLIGTTGVFINGKKIERDESTPTSPKVWEFMNILFQMAEAKCEFVVMEVTSFALAQNRIGPARFRIGIFTNLTRDHLDYHKTMENYYIEKRKLFTEHSDIAIINTDDTYGKRLYGEISGEKYSYGLQEGHSMFAANIIHTVKGMKFNFRTTSNTPVNTEVLLNMYGTFNVMNAVAALGCCMRLGMTVRDASTALIRFRGVRGRCEIIPTKTDYTVICDYAHTPDALAKLLPALKEHTKKRLICLFGCGGDRDATKRPLMAIEAEKYSDCIIVTSDNPRNEDPDAIIDEIVAGFSDKVNYTRITDRREAIAHGLSIAEKGDILVLAGKGHEDYQILEGGVHIHFDEREIVAECLKKMADKAAENAVKQAARVREKLTLDEVCEAVSGKPFGTKYDGRNVIYADEISSDTRSVKRGALFIGIKGDNFDGNAFASLAVNQKGAVCALTDRIIPDTPCIVVRDTRKALLDLAGYYRKKHNTIVVGITGSVGKTTSKDFIALTLSSKYKTMKTEGNLNNHIGLPFTLLKITAETEAAVVEMGMSHVGEISPLSMAAKPDICVITNIGYSHIANMGSLENTFREKMDILAGTTKEVPLIINGDDKTLLKAVHVASKHDVVTCGVENQDCDFIARNIVSDENNNDFDIFEDDKPICHVSIPVIGRHYIMDALLAVAAARKAGCDAAECAETLMNYVPTGLRQHIVEAKGQKVIVDCYNASPISMRAAIDVLCTVKTRGKKVCVFGDMLELGSFSQSLHASIGEYAAKKGVDVLICYGKESKFAAETAEKLGIETFSTNEYRKLMDHLNTVLSNGDAVLFKGSRKMSLEKAVNELYGDV